MKEKMVPWKLKDETPFESLTNSDSAWGSRKRSSLGLQLWLFITQLHIDRFMGLSNHFPMKGCKPSNPVYVQLRLVWLFCFWMLDDSILGSLSWSPRHRVIKITDTSWYIAKCRTFKELWDDMKLLCFFEQCITESSLPMMWLTQG